MEKKIKRLKIGNNVLDIIVGLVLIFLGSIGGFSCFNSGSAVKVFVFALLAVIFIPMFIASIVFGIVLFIHGISNSIKISRNEKLVNKKTGTIVLIVFEIIFFALSVFFAILLDDYLQSVRFVGVGLLFVSIVLKVVYLVILKKVSKNNLNEKDKSFESDFVGTEGKVIENNSDNTKQTEN